MERKKILLLFLVCIGAFIAVYLPHFSYFYPLHADEWHHISQSKDVGSPDYGMDLKNTEMGFHIFLMILGFPLGWMGINLVLAYKFFPAIWAVFSGLVLFYVVYKKSDNSFYLALFSFIFFASIKSNINLMGPWFFTPLTFAIPFIFTYVYLFTEGVEKENKRYILSSLGIMLLLLPIHALSVLFAIPFLLVYCLFHMNYLKKEFRLFSLFLLIPIGGLVFYGIFVAQSPEDIALLFQHLSFKGGWGGGELQNSFFEIYSPIGYLLAFIGICLISLNQKMNKRYLIYLFWPICVLASMAVYKITGISFLSPYQRNWIYLAISLPFLSALGLNYLIEIIKSFNAKTKKTYVNIALTILITLVLVLSFWSYSKLPEQSKLNPLIDEKDYEDIVFLSGLEKGAVIADLGKSSAIYPISGQKPIAIMYFYGDPRENENFFKAGDCNYKKEIIQKYNIRYVLSEEKIDCGWKIIRSENSYIYQI